MKGKSCNIDHAPWCYGPRGVHPETKIKYSWEMFQKAFGHTEPETWGWKKV